MLEGGGNKSERKMEAGGAGASQREKNLWIRFLFQVQAGRNREWNSYFETSWTDSLLSADKNSTSTGPMCLGSTYSNLTNCVSRFWGYP